MTTPEFVDKGALPLFHWKTGVLNANSIGDYAPSSAENKPQHYETSATVQAQIVNARSHGTDRVLSGGAARPAVRS
jgi:hypothetical protein